MRWHVMSCTERAYRDFGLRPLDDLPLVVQLAVALSAKGIVTDVDRPANIPLILEGCHNIAISISIGMNAEQTPHKMRDTIGAPLPFLCVVVSLGMVYCRRHHTSYIIRRVADETISCKCCQSCHGGVPFCWQRPWCESRSACP